MPAANLLERTVDALLVRAVPGENRCALAPLLRRRGDEQVLDADVIVVQAFRLLLRGVEHRHRAGRRADLGRGVGQLGRCVERTHHVVLDALHVDLQPLKHLDWHAIRVVKQGQDNVLNVPLGVAHGAQQIVGAAYGLLRLLGEVVLLE